MAGIGPITVLCPACSEPITIPVKATPGGQNDDGSLTVHVGIAKAAITEHIEQHQTEPTA